jgi:hypothetical protein
MTATVEALLSQLPPESRSIAKKVELETESEALGYCNEREDFMIEHIARHFPGLAPAIRAVGQHILEGEPGPCCEGLVSV